MWSLGLSIIEIGTGQYPYPPETWSNVFAQLTTIVHNDAPELPNTYSEEARDWVAGCLRKDADARATYQELLVGLFCFNGGSSPSHHCHAGPPMARQGFSI